MENLPIFAGLYPSQVVSRISEPSTVCLSLQNARGMVPDISWSVHSTFVKGVHGPKCG